MLVLSRKTEQKIQIGNNIVITILRVNGDQVKIGIEAPREVRVMRSEVAGRTTVENVPEPNESAGLEVSSLRAMVKDLPAQASPPAMNKLPMTPVSFLGRSPLTRCRVPSALNAAPEIRPPQRLGPTSLRSLAGRCRR